METIPAGTLYLLHFDTPISHAKHYLGYADDLPARLARHANGKGARLTQVAVERGIGWKVAHTQPGTRTDERKLKNRKNAPRMCPICKGGHT